MMTRRDGVQQKMLCVTLESLMPEEHFLRQLDSLMDFSFIYQRVESLYSHRGRPSIDPVVVVKMLLLGYLYGIDSERRLEQEVRVNIAYRWSRYPTTLPSPNCAAANSMALRCSRNCSTKWFGSALSTVSLTANCCSRIPPMCGRMPATTLWSALPWKRSHPHIFKGLMSRR